jgi:hypothetical protein
MKRKMRKFADGGYSTAEGENKMIDDDVRSRAMKFVENASEESRDIGAPVTRSAAKSTSKVSQTVAPPKTSAPAMPAEEKARIEEIGKKQALERVEPENYIPGTGLLKNILKRGLKTIGPAKQLENKATKMLPYDKAGAMAKKRGERATARDVEMKRGNARNYGIDPDAPGSASALESLRKNIGSGEFAMKKGGKVSSYKSGGSIKSSASKRADGCAVRGKTRA